VGTDELASLPEHEVVKFEDGDQVSAHPLARRPYARLDLVIHTADFRVIVLAGMAELGSEIEDAARDGGQPVNCEDLVQVVDAQL
jgi:hypothetical protein